MDQLKMYLLPGTRLPEPVLPEGYSISNYTCEADQDEWSACCANGCLSITRRIWRSAGALC